MFLVEEKPAHIERRLAGGLGMGRAGPEGLAAEGEGEVGTQPGPGGTRDLRDRVGGTSRSPCTRVPGSKDEPALSTAAPPSWGLQSAGSAGQ